MTPHELISRIRQRSYELFFVRGVPFEQAEKQAAKELKQAGLQVELPRTSSTAAHRDVGIRDLLVEKLLKLIDAHQRESKVDPIAQMFERKEQRAAPTIKRTPPKVSKQTEPAPTSSIIGVYAGSSPTSGQRIPDAFFHCSMVDRTTANWRHSIDENARIEAERREVWARRLEEIRGKQ